MADRRSSTRIAMRLSLLTQLSSNQIVESIAAPPPPAEIPLHDEDVLHLSSPAQVSSKDRNHVTSKAPKRRQTTIKGRVTKRTSTSTKRRVAAKEDIDGDFVPDDFQPLSSEYQISRVTRPRSLNSGYQVEEEQTTRRTRRVTAVTRLGTHGSVPMKSSAGELKVALRVPILGKFLIKVIKQRRKETVYDNKQYRVKFNWTPYSYHAQPTAEAAQQVYAILKDWLFDLDGTIVEIDLADVDARDGPAHGARGISVDALVRVIMSQATSNENALTTQEILTQKFTYTVQGKEVVGKVPNYHKMRLCPQEQLLRYVSRAGLAERRSVSILSALQAVYDENAERLETLDGVELGNPPDTADFVPGLLSLDFLMEKDKVALFNWFCNLRGVGAKSSACLLEFNYGFQICAVDTHVHNIARYLGWIPDDCKDPIQAFNHLDARLPPHLKHAIHQQFWHHGQKCRPCKRKQQGEHVKEGDAERCPIESFIVKRLKSRKLPPKRRQESEEATKREPELGDTVAKGRYRTKELAASKGWIEEKYEINDDFDAGSKNKVVKERWKYVGIDAATRSTKKSLITTLLIGQRRLTA